MEQNSNKFLQWVQKSTTSRMVVIGVLSLILLIPLNYIENIIIERSYHQKNVVNEIDQQWGNEVSLYGPIIRIPYKTYTEKTITDKETQKVTTELVEHIKFGYFFPNKLDITSTINPEEKKRGIYKTAVFKSEIDLQGNFKRFNFSKIDIEDKDILWNKSKVIFKTSNVKGISTKLSILINNKEYDLSSATDYNSNDYYHHLESGFIPLKELNKVGENVNFDLKYAVKGSKEIQFIPIGKETNTQITSSWKTANFNGSFLPYNPNKINENGFNAKWKVLDINRPFAQEHFKVLPRLKDYAFGVNFKIPVDEYQKSLRTAKYGFLVITLTFLIFFIIQSVSKINMHPFQYLMIGIALSMFYTLLISISEHSNFLKAYTIASVLVILLISLYSKSILKSKKFMLFIFTSLLFLYTFIFIIIQLESYSLLVGSLGLFAILAAVMYVSRKIDWSKSL